MAKKFWQFVNATPGETAELLLFGPIADTTWLGDEVTPKQFAQDLAALGDISELIVRINSEGGDIFAAHAIYNLLQSHKATVTVRVDGLAASAATVVAMAGKSIIMPVNSMMMIHNPMTVAWGYASDLRKAADTLDTIRESIISAYMTRTHLSHDEIVTMMDNETWMTAQEAVKQGFATQVEETTQITASAQGTTWKINGVTLDLSRFKHMPKALLNHGGHWHGGRGATQQGEDEIAAVIAAAKRNTERGIRYI